MNDKKKPEEFEDDRKKWKIYFDLESESLGREAVVDVRFRLNRKDSHYLSQNDLEKLKQDLKDLGKLRIIKQGKDFLV